MFSPSELITGDAWMDSTIIYASAILKSKERLKWARQIKNPHLGIFQSRAYAFCEQKTPEASERS